MNSKKSINNKLFWSAPVVIGGILGLVVVKPKQSQSSQMVSPVANNTIQEREFSLLDRNDPEDNNSQKQSLDTYLLSAQSLLTKAIALSRDTQNYADEAAEGKTCEVGELGEVTPRMVAERTPPRCDEQLTVKERNQQIVELINKAIDTTNKAIANYPSSAQAYAQQAKIYQTIIAYMPEAKDAAIAYWQQAIKIDDNNPEYYNSLAELYLSKVTPPRCENSLLGRCDEAQENSSDGVGIGDLDLALYYLQKAVEADPTNPNRIKKLAEAQTQAGYINQAKITYQRLLGILSDENQKARIENEINSLNKLLAEAAASEETFQEREFPLLERRNSEELTLPDSPPKLQAHHLAGVNTYIAEPKDSSDGGRMDSSEVSNAKSGTATIPAGKKQVEICNDNLGPDTQVYLVPEENNQNTILFVKSKSPYNPESDHCPNFIAAIAKPLDTDLKFRWWIISE